MAKPPAGHTDRDSMILPRASGWYDIILMKETLSETVMQQMEK